MAVYAGAWPGSSTRRGGLGWISGALLIFVLSIVFNFVSQLLQPTPTSCGPPQCTLPPPKRGPLTANQVYTSSAYGFSLDYSTGRVKPSKTATSIAWSGQLNDGSDVSWSFTGMSANGRSPQQIVDTVQSSHFPDAQQAYTVPDASLGYTLGYGAVYDETVSPAGGESVHDRLLVFAAIRGGVAVVMVGLGEYQQSSQKNSNHPNPANTPLVQLADFEENVNSVTWRGEQGF